MVTKLGKDLQRVVKTASLTRKDSVWVGDKSIKESWGCLVWKRTLCSDYHCCFQIFEGCTGFSGSQDSSVEQHTWLRSQAKGRIAAHKIWLVTLSPIQLPLPANSREDPKAFGAESSLDTGLPSLPVAFLSLQAPHGSYLPITSPSSPWLVGQEVKQHLVYSTTVLLKF